jgi:Mrp family chromosome partitioning ATPase/capsular polysaccharide biosynthesis protein
MSGRTEPTGGDRRPADEDTIIGLPSQLAAREYASGDLGDDNAGRMSYPSAGYGRQRNRSSSEEQTLARYWIVLRERAWIIVACTVLVLAAAIAYVGLAPRTYQAQAEMEVQAAGSGDPVLAALPVLHQTGAPTEDVLTAASLVTTQPVAESVVRALHLKMSPGTALADVQASPIGQAGLVAVQATASSPQLAQRLANGFVDQAIALSTARLHAAIARALPTLQSQLAAVPRAQRYGPGSLGAQLDELQQLQSQNDPTLINAAPAGLPTAPSSPRTKLSLIAGLLAGLLVGVGAAFLFHGLDPRLRREEQLRDRFGMPVLARIPRQPHRRRPRPRPLLPSELSPSAQEGYRTLRTILTARTRSSEPRAVLVTGSAPAEGKSTTAMGLAAALAHGAARVILIEADLRKPTFAASFKLTRFTGIEPVLDGKVQLSKATVAVRIQGASLRVLPAHLPAGKGPHLPFAGVDKLISDAKAMADFVVIDSAPLTAVIDALPFAQAADEVLIVARLGHTRLNKLEELDDLLGENGVTRTGIVLIGEHPTRGVQYYYAEEDGSSDEDGSPDKDLPNRASIAPRRSRKTARQG